MSKSRTRGHSNQIRIIGGRWRGRKINFSDAEGLRPTADRVRETLFNWLASDIIGSRCLDMFAGSGALGFEALSRGASHCCFVEQNPSVLKRVQDNCRDFNATDRCELLLANANAPLPTKGRFDIVFLDPPFQGSSLEGCLNWLLTSPLITAESLIYIETAKSSQWTTTALDTIKEKHAGDVSFSLSRLRSLDLS